MKTAEHHFDFCVVGGGMAGTIAAITAARHGAKVALVQDRPVLGGNASSEIRMHICGAHGRLNREAGLLEEMHLENHYRNYEPNYSIWDSVVYGKAAYQEGLTLFLNCSVESAEMDKSDPDHPRIKSVTGWQLTSETRHTIYAKYFSDCSGDSILAPLSGAEFRVGREARSEFNESIAPVEADLKTMGMSCLFQAREFTTPQPFVPPAWAHKFTTPEDLRGRDCNIRRTNYWWLEVGGDYDSIHDTESLRDELLRIAFGVWDYIKNYSPDKDKLVNWGLAWQGFLPGKRESRRYIGDHILTQNDIEAEGRFEDIVAYGGWTMDDHFPAGFYHPEAGTIFHPAPSPYGIPLSTLYSRNIMNLFCAGRNHSATHCAMSSTRVMATCSLMGQAVGTAAAIAVRDALTPREVRNQRIKEVQQTLMDDDCWIPWHTREISDLSKNATLEAPVGDAEALRNGVDRKVDDASNCWTGPVNTPITYTLSAKSLVKEARMVFDSNFARSYNNMRFNYALDAEPWTVPETITKAFRIEAKLADGSWQTIHTKTNNYQRLVRVPLHTQTTGIRLIPESTWGADQVNIFAFELR